MQDLSKVIKDRIKNYDNIIRETETGYVIEVGDGIARIHGLDACKKITSALLFSVMVRE